MDFVNEESGNQFRTIVWRTTQKAVLDYFRHYPKANRMDVAKGIGDITEDGVKFIIGQLQQLGLLKREGGRKNGIWVVME